MRASGLDAQGANIWPEIVGPWDPPPERPNPAHGLDASAQNNLYPALIPKGMGPGPGPDASPRYHVHPAVLCGLGGLGAQDANFWPEPTGPRKVLPGRPTYAFGLGRIVPSYSII